MVLWRVATNSGEGDGSTKEGESEGLGATGVRADSAAAGADR
jgi:hypothetical protein